MRANFQAMPGLIVSDLELGQHADWLASFDGAYPGVITDRVPPPGLESYTCVDVMGAEFVWMNEAFGKDKITWYLWFESVFLVPEEMMPFLILRWS